MPMFSPHLSLAKELWGNFLTPQDLAIDATCGNGHDTLFLFGLCSVIGLDIQEKAVQETKKRFESQGKTCDIRLFCHSKIDELALHKAPKLIVYNLGYLPGSDKKVTTKTETSLLSAQKSLKILAPDGALSITCYPGHQEGALEESCLLQWAQELDSKKFLVRYTCWPNRSKSPTLLWISCIT